MNNLQKAINHFSQRFVESGGDLDYSIMAEALEEIRDLLTADRQPVPEEQPATFEPWHDVVQIIGPAEIGEDAYIGFEGVVIEASHGYKVHMAELEDCAWFPASSLRLVYRLKPRAQAEPQPDWAEQVPIFKRGETVLDIGSDRTVEIMQDVHSSYAQCRDVETNAPLAIHIDYLVRPSQAIDKPAPFQVGDWVTDIRVPESKHKILGVNGEQMTLEGEGENYIRSAKHLRKTDPPAPRFTFGDRVVHYDVTGLFIRYVHAQLGITKEQCQFLGLTDNNIHTCYAEELSLLDELPF